MQKPKIYRPEFTIDYVGIKGLLSALYAICKVGIKKVRVNCVSQHFYGYTGTVKIFYIYLIPKYKLKAVKAIENLEK
jgi:hypothetical protein